MPADNDSTWLWPSKAEQAAQEDPRAQPWKKLLSSHQDTKTATGTEDFVADYARSNQLNNGGCSVCGSSSCNSCGAPTVAG